MIRLPVFFAAPHRSMFFAGSVQALAAMLFWSIDLGGRHLGLWMPPAWPLLESLPPRWLHALLMAGGVFPFFIFGFILTAGPRWLGIGDLPSRHFLPAFLLLASGWLIVWTALLLPPLLPLGLGLVIAGWIAVGLTLSMIALHDGIEREHILYAACAVWVGAVGIGMFLAGLAGGGEPWVRLAINLVLWGCLLPMFLTVAHRMLPFFTASATRGYVLHRPAWALRVLLAASLGHGALSFLELVQWLWCVDLPATVAAVYLSVRWWSRPALSNRMLAVLHLSFAWLAPSFALATLQSLLWPLQPGILGLAALHALTLGFFASMLIGMVSRVTLGHSGRPVAADDFMWRAFLLMQFAAVLRVGGELSGLAGWLNSAAALCWLGAFGSWAWRYLPSYWRRRADGKEG